MNAKSPCSSAITALPPSLPPSLPPFLSARSSSGKSSLTSVYRQSPPSWAAAPTSRHSGKRLGGREGGREGEREYISLRFTSFCPSSLFSQMLEAAKDPERKPVVLLGDAGMRRVDTAGALSHLLPPPLPPFLLSVAPVLLPHLCHASNHILIDRPHCSPSLAPSLPPVLLHSLTAPNQLPALRMSAKEITGEPARFFGGKGEGGREEEKEEKINGYLTIHNQRPFLLTLELYLFLPSSLPLTRRSVSHHDRRGPPGPGLRVLCCHHHQSGIAAAPSAGTVGAACERR